MDKELKENCFEIFRNKELREAQFESKIGKYTLRKKNIEKEEEEAVENPTEKDEEELNMEGNSENKYTLNKALNRMRELIKSDCSAVELYDKNETLISVLYKEDEEGSIASNFRSYLYSENEILSSFLKSKLTIRISIGSTDDFVLISQFQIDSQESISKKIVVKESCESYFNFLLPSQLAQANRMIRETMADDLRLFKSSILYTPPKVEPIKPKFENKSSKSNKIANDKENIEKLRSKLSNLGSAKRTPFNLLK